MKNELQRYGLTTTQAAFWLDVEPEYLAAALKATDCPQWLSYCIDGMDKEFDEDPEVFDYYRLGSQLQEQSWSAITARASIPVLIEQAKKGEAISYGDLDSELRRRDPTRKSAGTLQKYGIPLGIIGDVIEEIRKEAGDADAKIGAENALMPPIETLVVRGREWQPGKGINGFMISYLTLRGERGAEDLMLLDRDRRKAVDRIQSDIFAWKDWSVLEKLAR
ncbi:hypothetical protein [uncultured Paracoccus sp.]|uniref:hypothetical protein n=1 Tax=uncultured Paracoccus sp. TaxID=189685 RepID=UPI002610C2B2|nr:hypothetical protein [uncultured Paracoccus sp.]